MVLFASRRLSLRICLRDTTSRVRLSGGFVFLDLIAPIVQDPARYPEVSCKCNNVSTRMFDSLLSKFLAAPLTLPSLHFATPFTQSVHDKSALAQENPNERPKIHQPETLVLLPVAMSTDTMYNLLMFMGRANQRMAQICCLCCAYVSSGTGRLVN